MPGLCARSMFISAGERLSLYYFNQRDFVGTDCVLDQPASCPHLSTTEDGGHNMQRQIRQWCPWTVEQLKYGIQRDFRNIALGKLDDKDEAIL